MAKHVTVAQLSNVVDAIETKTDARFRKVADKIAETDLATDLGTKLNGKADAATTLAGYSIGDAYTKNEVDTAVGKKADSATTLAGYKIGDAYTKTEVDSAVGKKANAADVYTKDEINGKLASGMHYKGTVASYSALPTKDQAIGDMYNITAADAANGIHAGDNVAWNGTGWDVLAGVIDLSGYASKDTVSDTENGLMSAADKKKLDGFEEATDEDIKAIVDGLYAAEP